VFVVAIEYVTYTENDLLVLPVFIVEQNLVGISPVMLVVFHRRLGTAYTRPVAAPRQVLAGPMSCHWKNRTWQWDLPVIFRWVRLPSEFRAYLCLFEFSVFSFFL